MNKVYLKFILIFCFNENKCSYSVSQIKTEFLVTYSPELQPAERLWSLVDEAIANENIESIDELEERLSKHSPTIISDIFRNFDTRC
jgi:transposase